MNIYSMMALARQRLHRLHKATVSAAKLRWRKFNRISMDGKTYERLKRDKEFICSVQLSRLVNIIRAAERNYLRIPDNGNLANTRDRIEFQYFYCSVIYEAVKSLFDLAGNLRQLKAWNLNADITKELNRERNDKNSYYQKVLATIRNTVVFHFDREAVSEALNILPVKEKMDLMVSQTSMNRDMVTPVAGNLVLNWVLSHDNRPVPGTEKYDYLLSYAIDLSKKLVSLCNSCILEIWTKYAKRSYERLEA